MALADEEHELAMARLEEQEEEDRFLVKFEEDFNADNDDEEEGPRWSRDESHSDGDGGGSSGRENTNHGRGTRAVVDWTK